MQNQFILSCIKIDLKPHPRAPADAFIYGGPCAEDSITVYKKQTSDYPGVSNFCCL